MVEIIKAKSPRGTSKYKYILRWEDDGGQIIEANPLPVKRPLMQPIRPAGHDQSWFRRFPKKEEHNEQKSWIVARPY
jgi:hypothetical protein